MTTEPLIDPNDVDTVFNACLAGDAESDGALIVEGIVFNAAFAPHKVAANAEKIDAWLDALPDEFHAAPRGGGGWTFLNACNDRNDVQWTGLHLRMGQLFMLGEARGRVAAVLPRAMWSAFPGGMPYYVIRPAGEQEDDPAPLTDEQYDKSDGHA